MVIYTLKAVCLWVKGRLLKAHREAKEGIIIASLSSMHPFSVNHRLFLISVPGRAGANPSSHLVRGRNLAHDLISHAHTSGQIRLSNQPNAQVFVGLWEENRWTREGPQWCKRNIVSQHYHIHQLHNKMIEWVVRGEKTASRAQHIKINWNFQRKKKKFLTVHYRQMGKI